LRHHHVRLAGGAFDLKTSPTFIAGNMLAASRTGEFELAHTRVMDMAVAVGRVLHANRL
jgi:hypothetical protein